MLLRDAKQCFSCLKLLFVGEIQQKQAIWCLKRKFLNINFNIWSFKTNITFVSMLIFKENVIVHVDANIHIYFLPPYLEFCDHS